MKTRVFPKYFVHTCKMVNGYCHTCQLDFIYKELYQDFYLL